jgi:aryl-alcohol dehydrogenase-like predicted oxidoreductase
MKTKRLGNGDLEVSTIGLGCMVMPGFYAPGEEAQSIATIHRAAEIGINFLDTSDAYGMGKNEELVGRAVAGRRNDYVIATKFGNIRLPDGKLGANGRPEYVAQACEASLRRLRIEVIDLYYQHRVDPTVPIEETVGAMSRLIEQGKVRYLGLSEAAPDTIRRGCATYPIIALQTEYSLWTRDAESDVLPLCAELGIAYVAYSPLGRGMFGGAITDPSSLTEGDRRREHPRFQEANLQQNLKLVEPVRELAAAKGCSPAQIALAWVLSQGEHVVPIPGTRRADHLENNAAALDVILDPDERAFLGEAVPPGAAAGTRYPPGGMKMLHL